MSLKGKEALHMYQIGIDIGGTNVKIGLLDEALELSRRLNGGRDLRATLLPHGANTLPKFQ